MKRSDVDKLRSDIGTGKLKNWEEIHKRYDKLWMKYPVDKQKHAFAVLCELYGTGIFTVAQWKSALDKAVKIQDFICEQVYITRKKDYDNTFRQATYRNLEEMTAAIGNVEDNSFIIQVRKESDEFRKVVGEIRKRG